MNPSSADLDSYPHVMLPRFSYRGFFAMVLAMLAGAGTHPCAGSDRLEAVRSSLSSGNAPVKIVCFGDSVTGVYYHTGGRRAYPELLGGALRETHPSSDITVINAGRSGHTTANALGRIVPDVLSRRPDLVAVMFGLNDVAKLPIETYRKNLVAIVSKCRNHGAEVILCTPNSVATTEDRPAERVLAYSNVVRSVAREWRVPLCDTHAELEALKTRDPSAWRLAMSDEIHPNLDGHRIIARALAATIAGKDITIRDTAPPLLGHTRTLLASGSSIRVLAMPPYDTLIGEALGHVAPGAKVSVTSWPTGGLTRYQLMKDAAHRVRSMAPDLVLIAVPRGAKAADREEFIRTQMWITNNSLSREKREWDVVAVHPRVAEGILQPGSEEDEWIRTITAAQDVDLIDRAPGDEREASEILTEWLTKAIGP